MVLNCVLSVFDKINSKKENMLCSYNSFNVLTKKLYVLK